MRQAVIVVLVIVAIAGGLAGAIFGGSGALLGRIFAPRATVSSPLASCTTVTADEARPIVEAIVAGFNKLDATPFNTKMAWDIAMGEAIHQIALSPKERDGFIRGAIGQVNGKNGPGANTVASLKTPDRMHLVRLFEHDGQQHAQIRVLIDGGFTYMDMLIARTPSGQVQLVDYTDLAQAQSYSSQVRELALPMLAQITKTPLERLVQGQHDDLTVIGTEVPKIRALMQAGSADQALSQFDKLPIAFRETRPGLMLRLQITQQLDGQPYQDAMAEIDRKFPNDPSMGLALLDWHLLAGRTAKGLSIIDRIDEQVGGDPYLDNIRALAHLLGNDLDAADAASARACEALPDLVDAWWTRVAVTLKRKDHVLTSKLLDSMGANFGLTFGDLKDVPDYADFVASPEYPRWLEHHSNDKPASKDAAAPAAP